MECREQCAFREYGGTDGGGTRRDQYAPEKPPRRSGGPGISSKAFGKGSREGEIAILSIANDTTVNVVVLVVVVGDIGKRGTG